MIESSDINCSLCRCPEFLTIRYYRHPRFLYLKCHLRTNFDLSVKLNNRDTKGKVPFHVPLKQIQEYKSLKQFCEHILFKCLCLTDTQLVKHSHRLCVQPYSFHSVQYDLPSWEIGTDKTPYLRDRGGQII